MNSYNKTMLSSYLQEPQTMYGWDKPVISIKTWVVSASVNTDVEANNRVSNGSKNRRTPKEPIGSYWKVQAANLRTVDKNGREVAQSNRRWVRDLTAMEQVSLHKTLKPQSEERASNWRETATNGIKIIWDTYNREEGRKREGNNTRKFQKSNHNICKYYLKTTDKEALRSWKYYP